MILFIIILHADHSILIFISFLLSSSEFRVWHHPVSSWYSLDCIIWLVLSWSYVSSSSSPHLSSSRLSSSLPRAFTYLPSLTVYMRGTEAYKLPPINGDRPYLGVSCTQENPSPPNRNLPMLISAPSSSSLYHQCPPQHDHPFALHTFWRGSSAPQPRRPHPRTRRW